MSDVKRTVSNDGNALKDSNANTDASNKPQVIHVCVFYMSLFVLNRDNFDSMSLWCPSVSFLIKTYSLLHDSVYPYMVNYRQGLQIPY